MRKPSGGFIASCQRCSQVRFLRSVFQYGSNTINTGCQGSCRLSLFCYPQTGEKYLHRWPSAGISIQGLRTVVLNQKDNMLPCLGTRAILKYTYSQWQPGWFVVLTPDEGFESRVYFNMVITNLVP